MASKINFKQTASKVVGLAAGTVAGGFLKKMLGKTNAEGKPMLNEELQGIALVGIGAIAPSMMGVKDPIFQAAGDAIAVKGIDIFLQKYLPSVVSGPDDIHGYNDVSGTSVGARYVDEYGVNGAQEIVAGPSVGLQSENVAGIGLPEESIHGSNEFNDYTA